MTETRRVPVTKEGLERLKAELEELKNVRRPEITAQVAEARSHGDLRENAAYDAARHDQMMNEKRIADLEALVRSAEVLKAEPANANHDRVRIGNTVLVDFDGDEERYTIVGAIEASPKDGLISNESPIGQALLGKRIGDHVQVATPGGAARLTVKAIE